MENRLEFDSLYNIYKKEFIDCCENILIEEKKKFLSNFFYKMNLIIKYIYIKDSNINNNLLLETIKKCENKFISEVYNQMYNICSSFLNKYLNPKLIEKTISKNGGITNQKLTKFLPHCVKEKNAFHICGNKFIQISNNNTNYAVCTFCKKCYFGNLIYMHCSYCNINYFSKIIKNNIINEEVLYPATWEKYHCNIMKNEQMSCINCDQKLWIKNNKLFCKKCKIEINPLDIFWTCTVCQKDFKSKAKIYNPLEYQEIKLKIRDAILYKKKVKPAKLPCKCRNDNEIDKIDFYHEKYNDCKGVLYYTQLVDKHLLVCSSCYTMCPLNKHRWFCPICKNNIFVNSVKIYNNNKIEKIINIDENLENSINERSIQTFENSLKQNKKIKNLTKIEDNTKEINSLISYNSINIINNKKNNKNKKNSFFKSNKNSLTERNINIKKPINKKKNNILELLTKKDKKVKKTHKSNISSYNKFSSINYYYNLTKNKISEQNSIKKYKTKIKIS